MKVLVTGGAGFVGSHIVETLKSVDHEVVVIDDLSSGDAGNVDDTVTTYRLNLCDDDIDEIFGIEKFDAVCHVAAKTNIRESLKDPFVDAQVNIIGLLKTLDACVNHNVSYFVFSSTGGALYGDTDVFPTPEKTPVLPKTPYGITKMAGERYCYFYHNTHGLNVTVLRYSNIYGPRLDKKKGATAAVLNIITNLKNGKQPEIVGNGEQTRDFIYVKDIAKANAKALENTVGFATYNIGSGIETSINTLFNTIAKEMGVHVEPKYVPAISGEVSRSVLDISKAKSGLHWNPTYSLQEGIREMIKNL